MNRFLAALLLHVALLAGAALALAPLLWLPRLMPFVEHGLQVELVDIAEREDWVEAYGVRIPVLRRLDDGGELGWPFDAETVAAFLGLPPAAES